MPERVSRSRVVVMGAGYAGLPLGLSVLRSGATVTFLDTHVGRIQALRSGVSHVADVPSEEVGAAIRSGRCSFTGDSDTLRSADVVLVCVPTPLSERREPDLKHVLEALEAVATHQRPGQLIIIESTVFPGMTREIAVPLLTKWLSAGMDVFIGYSPERLDPGNQCHSVASTPKVVSGVTEECLRRVVEFYSQVFEQLIPVSTTDTAEMVKLVENTFRAVNIGLVNELAVMARRLGIDPFEITRAAATKPFGFMSFSPGPGVGGHCIPVDPLYLNWKLKHEAKFITLADEVNSSMPFYVIDRLAALLAERGINLERARVLVYGVTYKPNVADTRESPALIAIDELIKRGTSVDYIDPFIGHLADEGLQLCSLDEETDFGDFDAVLVVTDHSQLPKERMCQQAKLVLDTRGALYPFRGVDGHVYTL